jgi:HEAT repeat protein
MPARRPASSAGSAHELSAVVLRLISESQEDPALEGVMATALVALAQLGGADALPTALAVLADPRPQLKLTALEALGRICDPGKGSEALGAVAAGSEPALATAAESARRRCTGRPVPSR